MSSRLTKRAGNSPCNHSSVMKIAAAHFISLISKADSRNLNWGARAVYILYLAAFLYFYKLTFKPSTNWR